MSRTCVALLLLGLASPAVATATGTATPASWTLVSGDSTIDGRTAVFNLVPRVVRDTAEGVDSPRVVDRVRATVSGPVPVGLAAGLANWPTSMYCDGTASAAVQPLDPRELLDRVQLASKCGMRLVLIIPRKLLTTTHKVSGPFSLDSAERAIDRYANQLPPDTLQKYRANLIGLNLADDYTCLRCWGGQEITQAQLTEWANYTRAKLAGLPLGIRRTPDWVAVYPPLAASIDYVWAQYHAGRGNPQTYFDRAAETASRLGLRVVMGVNVKDCNGRGSKPCSAEELTSAGTVAVNHPANCAFLSWRYEDTIWEKPEIRQAWDGLFALAKARPTQDCRRTSGS